MIEGDWEEELSQKTNKKRKLTVIVRPQIQVLARLYAARARKCVGGRLNTSISEVLKGTHSTLGNTLMNALGKNWRVSDEPSMSDHRVIRSDIEGDSDLENKESQEKRLALLHKIPKWPTPHPQGHSDIRSTMKLETMIESLYQIIIGAYEAFSSAEAVT